MVEYYKRIFEKKEVTTNNEEIWIYEKLIKDETEFVRYKNEKWEDKVITRWQYFHIWTTEIKSLKDKQYFLDRIEQEQKVVQVTDIKDWETMINGSFKIEKVSKWIKVTNNNKEIFIWIGSNWRLTRIEFWGKNFKLKNTKRDLEFSIYSPVVFVDLDAKIIKFSAVNKDYNQTFAASKDWKIDDLFNKLESWKDFTLIEDYSFWFDLEMRAEE
jgi:hypothetical protein